MTAQRYKRTQYKPVITMDGSGWVVMNMYYVPAGIK